MNTIIKSRILKLAGLVLSILIMYFYFTHSENSSEILMRNEVINKQTIVQKTLWKSHELKKSVTENVIKFRADDREIFELLDFFYDNYHKTYTEIKPFFDKKRLNENDIKIIQKKIATLQKITQDSLSHLAEIHVLYKRDKMKEFLSSLKLKTIHNDFDLKMTIQIILNQLIINLDVINHALLSVMSGNNIVYFDSYQPFLNTTIIPFGKSTKLELVLGQRIDYLHHLEMSINNQPLDIKDNIGHLELPIKNKKPNTLNVKATWDCYFFTKDDYDKKRVLEEEFTIYPH